MLLVFRIIIMPTDLLKTNDRTKHSCPKVIGSPERITVRINDGNEHLRFYGT